MPKHRTLRAEEVEGGNDRLGVLGVVLIAIIVAFGIAGAGTLWYQQTSTDTFCAQTCHSMQKAALSWTRSPHSSVSCIRCHEDSGLANMPRNSAYRLFYVYRQYVDNSHVVPLAVPASRCLSCHTDLLDTKLIARNGDPFTHRTVLADGASCRSCHRSQGHEPGRK
jgi:nitrate/TMAO reductase-like tetraheme cytochrome c subunit